ncbi:MAG: hypothetical protein AB7Q37_05850 [Pyrinomonadaceae bacterium]
MELLEISKNQKGTGEIKLLIAGKQKKYEFSYRDGELFAVDFPEDLRKILRILPPKVTQGLVKKIKNFTEIEPRFTLHEAKFEAELLRLV